MSGPGNEEADGHGLLGAWTGGAASREHRHRAERGGVESRDHVVPVLTVIATRYVPLH